MSINTVRATVMSIANKNNYGYITPSDFNLYAKQAQLDIFEDYFYQYNSWLIKQNSRVSGSGYADIVKSLIEVVDSFSETKALVSNTPGINLYDLPNDYYLINKINYYPNSISTGSSTIAQTDRLIDQNADFTTDGVQPGMLVLNTSNTGNSAFVVSITSSTQLELSANVNTANGQTYAIVNNTGIREVERVSQNKIFYLNSSPLTTPNITYPAYVLGGATSSAIGNTITVYPTTLNVPGSIISQYVRYPNDPNWTYFDALTGGEPIFNEGAADYQNFELPESDEPNLVNKILQYAGISIREMAVAEFGKVQEQENNTEEG